MSCHATGSSPRVRGKLKDIDQLMRIGGLIPACAGKTVHVFKSGTASGAHPRVCGENIGQMLGDELCEGSSPRVRGKRARFARLKILARLIPACAGKTW